MRQAILLMSGWRECGERADRPKCSFSLSKPITFPKPFTSLYAPPPRFTLPLHQNGPKLTDVVKLSKKTTSCHGISEAPSGVGNNPAGMELEVKIPKIVKKNTILCNLWPHFSKGQAAESLKLSRVQMQAEGTVELAPPPRNTAFQKFPS